MSYEIPSVKELWAMLPGPCRAVVGWVLALGICVGIVGTVASRYGSTLREQWQAIQGEVGVSAFELAQMEEDKRHVGRPYEILRESEELFVALFADGSVLSRHVYEGDESRLWKIHPKQYGAPPELVLEYGSVVSSAGVVPSTCDPYEACLPVGEHPGEMRVMNQSQLDQCWWQRWVQYFNEDNWTDGCELSVPYNACGNYYSWAQAAWVCCYWH